MVEVHLRHPFLFFYGTVHPFAIHSGGSEWESNPPRPALRHPSTVLKTAEPTGTQSLPINHPGGTFFRQDGARVLTKPVVIYASTHLAAIHRLPTNSARWRTSLSSP
jgi:hypothetical protein